MRLEYWQTRLQPQIELLVGVEGKLLMRGKKGDLSGCVLFPTPVLTGSGTRVSLSSATGKFQITNTTHQYLEFSKGLGTPTRNVISKSSEVDGGCKQLRWTMALGTALTVNSCRQFAVKSTDILIQIGE